MDIVKIIGVGLVTVVVSMLVKPVKPEISILISLCGGIIMIVLCVNYIAEIIDVFTNLVKRTGLNLNLFKIILKIIGVGYLTEFSASLCNDTGNTSIGEKIIFAGKVIILVISLPIITEIIEIIMEILPWKNCLLFHYYYL